MQYVSIEVQTTPKMVPLSVLGDKSLLKAEMKWEKRNETIGQSGLSRVIVTVRRLYRKKMKYNSITRTPAN